MSVDTDPLCCCEYFDIQQQRNHILACCCNCQDLDESFESLITGKGVPPHRAQGFMATLQDRMRIPWHGGARQVAPDAILPIFLLPIMLLLASINFWWTLVMFSLMFLMLFYFYCCCASSLKGTKFFLVWTVTSVAVVSLIFEFIVVPFLEILIHENVALTVLVGACVACIYIVRLRGTRLRYMENEVEIGDCGRLTNGRTRYCSICQICVPEKDHHCVWIDCCIGFHNRFLFLVAVLLAIGALLYSSNLTLTSVCHPYHVYKTILLPDDCSDVYEQFELSLSFVSAIYSVAVACALGIFLLYEVLLISIGLTGQEWRALPFSAKLCCAITVHRPYDQGFFSNWFRITYYGQKYHKVACQY